MRRIVRFTVGLAAAGVPVMLISLTFWSKAALAIGQLFVAYVVVLACVAVILVATEHTPAATSPAVLLSAVRDDSFARNLRQLEDRLALAEVSAIEFHYRLRPLLRGIAAEALLARGNIDLDGDPLAAREILGEKIWNLLRGGVDAPRDRTARGPSRRELGDVLEGLASV